MNASTYEQPLPPDWARTAATGYYSNGKQVKGRWRVYSEMAAGGLWTTASDLAQFAISLQKSYAGLSNPVISQPMTFQMLTRQKEHFGLGFALTGSGKTLRFHHDGRNAGFDAFLAASPELGIGVVIMLNANDNSGAVGRIADAVVKEYHWSVAE